MLTTADTWEDHPLIRLNISSSLLSQLSQESVLHLETLGVNTSPSVGLDFRLIQIIIPSLLMVMIAQWPQPIIMRSNVLWVPRAPRSLLFSQQTLQVKQMDISQELVSNMPDTLTRQASTLWPSSQLQFELEILPLLELLSKKVSELIWDKQMFTLKMRLRFGEDTLLLLLPGNILSEVALTTDFLFTWPQTTDLKNPQPLLF